MSDQRGSVEFTSVHAQEMFAHYVLFGAGALCEAADIHDVRLSWSSSMRPHPVIHGDRLTLEVLAQVVHEHAQRLADPGSWLHRGLPHDEMRGLMSPRIGGLGDDRERWVQLQVDRHGVEDELDDGHDELSAALIGALGEPAYWRFNRQRQRLQDDGASRLEMQPRNQGSEFIGSRLRPLASHVAQRAVPAVVDALAGRVVIDDMGRGAADSRTATNLRPLGPTDSVLAWLALWGISQVPLVHRVDGRSATATHARRPSGDRHGSFVLPLWQRPWRPARVRALLASRDLSDAARTVIGADEVSADGLPSLLKLRRVRGVEVLVVFPVAEYGSASAPERRALSGTMHPMPDAHSATPSADRSWWLLPPSNQARTETSCRSV